MAIDRQKRQALEYAYRAGYTPGHAALRCDVTFATAAKYFRFFRISSISRATPQPVSRKPRRPRGLPVYTGPAWIGLPA